MVVDTQLREMWGHVACMMLVPNVCGIGKLMNKLQRGGTMQWNEHSKTIDDMRWGEFVRGNFMRTMLLAQPRQVVGTKNLAQCASQFVAVPLNSVPCNATWESCIEISAKTRKEQGWPENFETWSAMKSRDLAKKIGVRIFWNRPEEVVL